MLTGRKKRNDKGVVIRHKVRAVVRGDLQAKFLDVDPNEAYGPTAKQTTAKACFATANVTGMDECDGDFDQAYLQGKMPKGKLVVIRAPLEWREYDERGVEIVWIVLVPIYGIAESGAYWNATVNETLIGERSSLNCTELSSNASADATNRWSRNGTRTSRAWAMLN